MQKLFSNCYFLRNLKFLLLFCSFLVFAADMHLPSTDIKTVQSSGLTFTFSTSQPTSLVLPKMSTTTRGNFGANTEGQFIYNLTSHQPEFWNGSAWSAAAGSSLPLTTLGDILYENATPANARLPGNTTSTKKFLSQTGTGVISAAPAWLQPACGDLSNGVASCSTDTTNASNISSGTLPAGRLPNPSASTLGGVQSAAAVTNQWINSISTAGVPALSQPAFSNISGTASLTTQVTGTLPIANGGTNNGSLGVVAGSMYYADGSKLVSMGAGSAGQVPVSTGTAVGWGATVGGNFANLITNGDFSNSTTGWTASGGTFTTVTNGANFMGVGLNNATWDSSAAAQTLTSPSYTISGGYAGTNGLYRCKVWNQSAATQTMGAWDGSTLTNTTTIDPGTVAKYVEIAAPFGAAATTTAIRFTSVASNEPLISIADCYVGPNFNIGTVSQAILVGESYFAGAASCVWSRASATIGAFSTSATCPGPTVVRSYDGSWQTTDVDLPIQTVNNLPPGVYEATFQSRIANSSGAAALAINDGTTTCEPVYSNDDTTFNNGNTVSCTFEYTAAGSHAFQLYAASTAGTVNVNNTLTSPRTSLKFTLRRFPNQSQQAVRIDQSNYGPTAYTPTLGAGFGTATNISFFQERKGSWLHVYGTFTVGTTAASASTISLPGTLTLDSTRLPISNTSANPGPMVGNWEQSEAVANTRGVIVTATGTSTTLVYFGNSETSASSAITPGNGNAITASSVVMTVDFLVPILGWTENQSAPLLVGSVTSLSTGMLRIESAKILGASTGAVTNASSNWISGTCSLSASTVYTCPILAGTFSGTPNCVVSTAQDSPIVVAVLNTTSASQLVVRSGYLSSTGGVNATDITVICMGPR